MTAAPAPFASIIVPTRNRPGQLRRALESIALQTNADFEVLVVDDGSSEEHLVATRALQAEFDRRFVFVYREAGEHRHGPGVARNAGILRARGRYVGFLDDDDYWCDTGHLDRASRALGHRRDADLYLAGQVAMRGETVVVSSWLPHLDRVVAELPGADRTSAHEVSKRDLLQPQGIGFAHVNMCFARRETVRAAGDFWADAAYEEDLDFFLRLVDAAGAILYCAPVVSVQTLGVDGSGAGAASIDAESRAILRVAACQHALLNTHGREVRAYARLLMGGALKTLARQSHRDGKRRLAADLALQAAGVAPSLRWLLIAAYLQLRAILPHPVGMRPGNRKDKALP